MKVKTQTKNSFHYLVLNVYLLRQILCKLVGSKYVSKNKIFSSRVKGFVRDEESIDLEKEKYLCKY